MAHDVLVVGGGLGGAMVAAVLSRAGLGVVVVDRHAIYPSDFRAEQLVGSQADVLRRLGLLDGIVGQASPMPNATAACRGKLIERTDEVHYGFRYDAMVNATRSLADRATFMVGRVAQVTTSPELQTAVLADGTTIQARLVVLATGPNDGSLPAGLGIKRTMLSEHHSLTFGFDLQAASRDIFVCYGERAGDRMDYLTVFPIGDAMRANLFCYVDPGDPWVKLFKHDPKQALLGVMPSLAEVIGPFEVVSKVQARPNSIQRAENVEQRAGVVLIGDAYQSPCPAVGSGIGRILSEVEVLSRLVPSWLATPGMDADKITQFYGDRAKRRYDDWVLRDARFRRVLCSETGWRWRAYRAQHYYRHRTMWLLSRAIGRASPVAASPMAPLRTVRQARNDLIRAKLALNWRMAKRAVVTAITLLT